MFFYNNQSDQLIDGGGNAGDGGAIANYPETDIGNNLNIYNSLFVDNYAFDDGGAIGIAENTTESVASTVINNCTFFNNNSGDKGNSLYLSFNYINIL